ncbi:MAG: imidazole glycerol phosphate synthase subunit HisH [Planctomycetota bacterium]
MSTVSVVDYGLGNLHSVIKALHHLGATVTVAEDAATVLAAERLVVPGVGAFADGMTGLTNRGQVLALRAVAARGTPIAGICLGAQLLLARGEEFGSHTGLGIVPGTVRMIPRDGVKIPHVGWNRIEPHVSWTGSPLATTAPGTWAYFVHSYQMMPDDSADILAVTKHGTHTLTAAVRHGRVTGFQFHPEKSGPAGLAMLAAFLAEPTP